MATQRQINANRRNAQLSTGPVTPEGKARVALNSLTHGFRAEDAVIPCEDRQEFFDLFAALEAEQAPSGPFEEFAIFELACAQWRLQRLIRTETGFLTTRFGVIVEYERGGAYEDDRPPEEQHPPITPENERAEQTRRLGKTFHQNCSGDPFTKLVRYENIFRRAYYKALDNLRALQATRAPAAMPPLEKVE